MTKTLADMTAEECVGMWCNIAGAGRLCVLLSTENDMAHLGFSCDNEFTTLTPFEYKYVTPRFDLPRVWTPDGDPVDGTWEKSSAELPTKDYKATYTQHYRRWIGDWEQVSEPRKINGMVNPYV